MALMTSGAACTAGDTGGSQVDGDAQGQGDDEQGLDLTETGSEGVVTESVSGTEASSAGDGQSGAGARLDVPFDGSEDGGQGNPGDCPDGGGMSTEYEFSIIWVANTAEHTVSKIDTKTATELARYATGPGDDDPSRTSVNLLGDVAIGNRHGSVTKIAAREEGCVDGNGDGAIQTSTGPGDVLPWGQDECVSWRTEVGFMPQGDASNQGGPRAIAWDAGQHSATGCHAQPKLWVGFRDQPKNEAKVLRLDGETGAIEDEVVVPDWKCNWGHGTYGGATNADGDFWGLGTLATLIHIDAVTLAVTRFDHPDEPVLYGIALDQAGNPWMAGWDGHIWHFDVATETFEDKGGGTPRRLRGIAIDSRGQAWAAGNDSCALVQFDTRWNKFVQTGIALPNCDEPVGVSIDVDGFVWVVDRYADRAYKVDPSAYTSVEVGGLVNPYTYSDMTGAGLGLVINPPIG